MLDLAVQNKFAYVSSEGIISITNITDTSTSPERSLSSIPEENSTYSRSFSESPLQERKVQSNVLQPNMCQALSTESELSDNKTDLQKVKPPELRTKIASKFRNTEGMFIYPLTSELSDNNELIQQSPLIPETFVRYDSYQVDRSVYLIYLIPK